MKTTTADPADGDWDNQDNAIVLNSYNCESVIKSLWAVRSDKIIARRYFFDVSDAGPTDPQAVWNFDIRSFEDTASGADTATNGTSTNNYLEGEGTNAPSSGPSFDSVQISLDVGGSGTVCGIRVTTDAAAETLLDDVTGTLGAIPTVTKFDLPAPSGGWTYAKLQALEVRFWRVSGGSPMVPTRCFIELMIDGIAVATQQESGRVAFHAFNVTDDDWDIVDEQVGYPGDTDFDTAPSQPACGVELRSNGDVVVVAAYNDTSFEQLRLFVKEEGVWANVNAASVSGDDRQGVSIIGPDSSGRIAWIHSRPSSTDLLVRSVDADNNTTQAQYGLETSADTTLLLAGKAVMDGDTIYVSFVDGSNDVSVKHWTSIETIVVHTDVDDVSDEAVLFNGASSAPYSPMSLVAGATAGDIHLLYASAVDNDLIHDDDATAAGGGTETTAEAGTANRISALKGISDILYFWDDAGVLKFGTIVLTAPAGPSPGRLMLLGVGT